MPIEHWLCASTNFILGTYSLDISRTQANFNRLAEDAGTWYGLSSKIVLTEVLRDAEAKQHIVPPHPRRSIVVPVGAMLYKRRGPHVEVTVDNDGSYGIFTINNILQRIDCQAEPRLLYLKAQYHAFTSFVIPDPLTGRTGTEEALHLLRSGICQPWSPLDESQNRGLIWISRLTPRREYYPTHLKVMQKTFWDPHLTTNIQHDCFRAFVDAIHKQLEELAIFSSQSFQIPQLDPTGERHLTVRSQIRRQAYQRPNSGFLKQALAEQSLPYPARHFQKATPVRENVLEITRLARSWSSRFPTTEDLASLLHGQSVIGGFKQEYNSMLLSDLFDLDLSTHWGSLVNFCCGRGYENRYEMMFILAVLTFGHTSQEEFALIRALLAFAVFTELKKVEQPIWPSYSNFQFSEIPMLGRLFPLVAPFLVPYPGDDRSILRGTEFNMDVRQWRQLQNQERVYMQQQENDGKRFIRFLLEQWPCQEPKLDGLPDSLLIESSRALGAVLPEWFRMYQNYQLSVFLTAAQKVLDAQSCEPQIPLAFKVREQEVLPTRVRGGDFPQLSDLLRKTCRGKDENSSMPKPRMSPTNVDVGKTETIDAIAVEQVNRMSQTNKDNSTPGEATAVVPTEALELTQIQGIVGRLMKSKQSVRRQYGQDLGHSLVAFRRLKGASPTPKLDVHEAARLVSQIPQAQLCVGQHLSCLQGSFEGSETLEPVTKWLKYGDLWPCVTPVTLLETLRSTTSVNFGKGMKESLIGYALSITSLQRLLRMESAYQKRNLQQFMEEFENIGHSNWQPLVQTDWLLLEIDANLLIRPGQIEVAVATISPASQSNSVLQMVSIIHSILISFQRNQLKLPAVLGSTNLTTLIFLHLIYCVLKYDIANLLIF
jgi:hypothetical protein